MRERVLAGCSYGGDCPGVSVRPDGDVAVTGALPDGTEATVVVPAGVFDEAARTWVGRRPWFPRVRFDVGPVGCAVAGAAVAQVVQDFTGSAGWADVAGLPVVVLGVFGLFWWRRRAVRRG